MKKRIISCLSLSALMSIGLSVALFSAGKETEKVEGYSTSSLPTTIDLNDTSAANIRSYYSSLNSLETAQRQGNNLLKNLKAILKNGQKYYSYDSGNAIWQIYEIADRDWDKSPASSTTYGTYNSSTNKITGYTYGTSSSSSKNNPYIHALYINRNVTNQTTAWDDHQQTQWGINREHVWPKAEGFEDSGAGGARGDPMHLMAGNGYANNIHSNYYYGYVNTSSSYTNCGSKYSNLSGNLRGTSKTLGGSTSVFEPQDCDKGDIARAIFYMVARYNYLSSSDSDGIDSNNPNLALTQSLSDWASSGYSSTTSKQGKMGIMTDLLAWHHADPVDEYEIHRNNLLYTNYTNNRNPFIDFPEWADFIWGSVNYNGSTYVSNDTTPTGYATPSSDTINGYNSGGSTVSVTGVTLDKNSATIAVNGTVELTPTVSPSNATNKAVTWSSSNTSIATVSNGVVTGKAAGNATITVTTMDGSYTATCTVTVKTLSSITVSGQTTAFETGDDFVFGGTVTAHYSDSTTANVTSGASFSGYDLSTAGNQTVTVSYGGKTTTYSITVTQSSSGTEEGSVTAASGALEGWTASGTGSAYADGSVKFDSSSDNVYKTDIFTATCAAGMTSLTVTINSKINGTPTESNSYRIDALDSSGNVLTSVTRTGADVVTSSYGDSVFTIDSDLTGCTGFKITYATKGAGNWGIKTVSWVAEYSNSGSTVTLSSIAVKTAPTKVTYTVGDGFDANGLVITATYSDSSTEDISYEGNEDDFEFDPIDNLQTSDVSVTIHYGGKTCTQSITVSATKTLSTIAINTDNVKKSFYVDDEFNHDNLVVTANFSDSSSDVVSSSASVSTPDMSSAGEKTITVSYTYGGTTKTATYTITVLESGGSETGSYTWDLSIASYETPTSASLVTWSSDCATMTAEQAEGKTATNNYLGGDSNARTSSRFYSGNTMRFVPATNYAITSVVFTATSANYATALSGSNWTNATASASGVTVTITPTNGSQEFYGVHGGTTGGTSVVVNYSYTPPASLSSITLDTSNVQTTFSVGDTFNYTGLVVTAHYTDLSSKTVTPSSVSTPSTATTGNKTVTVTYTEEQVTKTADYTITVNASPSISWTAPTINVYSGTILTSTEANSWEVAYNNGTGSITHPTYGQFSVKLGGVTISLPYTWKATDDGNTLTVTYNSLTTTASPAVQIAQTVNTISASVAENYDYTFESKQFSAAGTVNLDGHSWTQAGTLAAGTGFWGYDGTKGQQFGSGSSSYASLSLTCTDFNGTVNSVTVYTSGASSVNATVQVSVGGTSYGDAKSITSSNAGYTFDLGGKSGNVVISWSQTSSKAIYVKEIVVNTSGTSVISNSVDHIAAQRLAVKFAKAFNAAMDTTSGCTTNLSSAWSACSDAYDTFISEANALGETEAAYAKSLIANATKQYTDDSGEACIERMMKTYEVCVQKHGQTPFMSELVTLSKISISPLQVSVKNSSTTIIIVVISALSVIAIGGYFYFRKKKEN